MPLLIGGRSCIMQVAPPRLPATMPAALHLPYMPHQLFPAPPHLFRPLPNPPRLQLPMHSWQSLATVMLLQPQHHPLLLTRR